MNKFEELKKEIKDSMKNPESLNSLGEVFTNFGITPDNPEIMQQILKDAGIQEEMNPEKAAEMVKSMTQNLPPEMKKYMADLIIQVSSSMPTGPMPDDVKELLDSWKQGGKDECKA